MMHITWRDGRKALHAVATQATARWWAQLGRELNLPLIAQIEFNGWPIFGPEELESLILEFEKLRDRIAEEFPDPPAPGWSDPKDSPNQIISELRLLRGQSDWEGDFG